MKLTLAKVLARKKYQEVVLYLTHLPVSGNFCHQLITFANSLDPDQAGENVFLHPVGIGPSGGWGGGGVLSIFLHYVGSDPASTLHPKKYQEFQAPKKQYL